MSPRAVVVPIAAFMLLAGCFQAQAPPPAATAQPGDVAKDSGDPLQRIGVLEDDPDEQSVATLTSILRVGTDPAARREAVYVLADLGGEAVAATIAQALLDPDDSVRLAAIDVLSTMDGETPAGLLVGALNDANPRIRLAAVDAFGDIDGPTSSLALQQALADPDIGIREAAAELLEERESLVP